MKNFYSTYGQSDVYPYEGGYTVIQAKDFWEAQKKHIRRYGYTIDGYARYCCIYHEEEFKELYPDGMNMGSGCHETID